MEPTGRYHLFGDLYLDPNSFFLRQLERIMPYIRDLDSRQAAGK